MIQEIEQNSLQESRQELTKLPVSTVGELTADMATFFGIATRPSGIPRSGGRAVHSPTARVLRGYEYHKLRLRRRLERFQARENIPEPLKVVAGAIKSRLRDDRESLQQLDEFESEFQVIKKEEIELPELGTQPVTYSEVNLSKDEDAETVFIVPAFSGTIYGVESIARAWAKKGKRVVTFNYPESQLGEVTPEFADRVMGAFNPDGLADYSPHTDYFKKAMLKLSREGEPFQIVSYSTGGPITAEILNDEEFSDRVSNALLISPASMVKQSGASLYTGMLEELQVFLPRKVSDKLTALTDSGIVLDLKGGMPEESKDTRKAITGVLFKKVCQKSDAWEGMSVRDGGVIVIQEGTQDMATKAVRVADSVAESVPQAVVLEGKGWTHVGPLYHADRLVDKVEEIQASSEKGKKIIIQ